MRVCVCVRAKLLTVPGLLFRRTPLAQQLTQVVMPREEKRAISFSKLIPPTPITSIMSAGLLRVLGRVGREGNEGTMVVEGRGVAHSPIQRTIISNGRNHDNPIGSQFPHLHIYKNHRQEHTMLDTIPDHLLPTVGVFDVAQ